MKTENKLQFVNVFDDDFELLEYCRENDFFDGEEDEFDALSFFEGDPDIIKINGETGYFCKCGNKVFFYFDDFKGHAEKMLQIFFTCFSTGVTLGGDSYLSRLSCLPDGILQAETWEEWDKLKTGIAWRGGAGYIYTLLDFDEWAEQNQIANYSTK